MGGLRGGIHKFSEPLGGGLKGRDDKEKDNNAVVRGSLYICSLGEWLFDGPCWVERQLCFVRTNGIVGLCTERRTPQCLVQT